MKRNIVWGAGGAIGGMRGPKLGGMPKMPKMPNMPSMSKARSTMAAAHKKVAGLKSKYLG